MARALCLSAALLLCVVAVQASRFHLEEADSGRFLLEKQPNCTRIHAACDTCRNQRVPGTRRSVLVCSTCITGYRLRKDGESKTCDCASGLAFNAQGVCKACPLGKYCPGGDAKVNKNNEALPCPTGLATTFPGAKSQAQCFTQAGYGRVSKIGADGKVTLEAVECLVGTYNVGENTAGCQQCGAGLMTSANKSDSSSLCLAPAGSYMDKGVGKLCQKGTYSTALNDDATCTPCPAGITTASEGSNKASDCSKAMKGYYLANDTQAELCDLDTYQDQEAQVYNCTQCPNGWKTKETGATGVALCLAPPGYELKPNATSITQCENGHYKADWNRNPCDYCGDGLITAATGAVSKDACLVPAGYGLTRLVPEMKAEPCELNTYGAVDARVAASNARCTACPADTYTLDKWATRVDLYTSEADCKVAPGWGMTATLPQVCPKGTYNAGKNRSPCTQCGTGWTTTDEEKTSNAACVIQPGWKMAADGIPAPCDKGSWSGGGSEGAPNATCTRCGTGFSTQEDEAVAGTECAVCSPGYGYVNSTNCAKCPYNTFAWGGAAETDACIDCATGSVSRRGASQSQQCYSELIDARNDVYNLADETNWVPVVNATNAAACGTACAAEATCVLYQFTGVEANVGTCKMLATSAAAGAIKAGFKIGNADDYAVYRVATKLGAYGTAEGGVTTEAACLAACTDSTDCEVYLFDAAAVTDKCFLAKSELEEDVISMFHVQGSALATDAP